MTKADLVRRNRANAEKSTGPKSATGKSIVARNAVTHGATGQADPAAVAAWLRIILDAPDLSLEEALEGSPEMSAALALAEAEAGVCSTAAALVAQRRGDLAQDPAWDDMDAMMDWMKEIIEDEGATKRELRDAARIFARVDKLKAREIGPDGTRERLLTRYHREALSARRRAFAAWIALQEEGYGEEAFEAA